MLGLSALSWRLWRSARNTTVHFIIGRPLRGLAVLSVLLLIWALLGGLFVGVLLFLDQEQFMPIKARLVDTLLALFFFCLFFLVLISDAVLVWSALLRTRAALFQAQLPVDDRALYWSAVVEGGLWAGWAVLVLALPLAIALAVGAARPASYLPAALATLIAFIACCCAAGSLGALLLARLIPLLRRGVKGIIALAVAALLATAVVVLGSLEEGGRPTTFLNEVVGRLDFAGNPFLPPAWTQAALAGALAGRWAEWGWHIGLLLATTAGLAVIGEMVAGYRLRRDLDALSGRGDDPGRHALGRSRQWKLLPLLPRDLALLVAKDLRLFGRDPAQVVQFTTFFVLLGFYLLMLPRIGRAFLFDERWRPVVSLLNLTAISMALATFTGRFVYPLLSLEGRRLWVLVLAPWERTRVVTAKYAFALIVGLPVSITLVVLSGAMLALPIGMIAYQAVVVAALGSGLAAGALGIGARLADYQQDNPGKLVAGYGGNINLLASLAYSTLLIAGAVAPQAARGAAWGWLVGISWTLLIAGLWTSVFLRLAWRWFGREQVR